MTGTNKLETRRKSHAVLNRLFSQNANLKLFTIKKSKMNIDFSKLKNIGEEITVVKPGESITSTGSFYAPITVLNDFTYYKLVLSMV